MLAIVPVRGHLIGHPVNEGGDDEYIALLRSGGLLFAKESGDHIGISGGKVGLGAGIYGAGTQLFKGLSQFLLGDIVIESDGRIVDQLHNAIHQGVDVIVLRLCVLDQIQDVLLRRSRFRHGIRLLEPGVTCLGDGS